MNPPLVPLGKPRGERADAARNREHLLDVARELIAEQGAERVTMDGLAERACLGKGTVFRRFGTRAGIFRALLDADDHAFQDAVLRGPPPLGPGADPAARLAAYGRARIAFLLGHFAIARGTIDRNEPTPATGADFTRIHIRMLLGLAGLDAGRLDTLAVQLTAALEGPIVMYMWAGGSDDITQAGTPMADSWQLLVERICRS